MKLLSPAKKMQPGSALPHFRWKTAEWKKGCEAAQWTTALDNNWA